MRRVLALAAAGIFYSSIRYLIGLCARTTRNAVSIYLILEFRNNTPGILTLDKFVSVNTKVGSIDVLYLEFFLLPKVYVMPIDVWYYIHCL